MTTYHRYIISDAKSTTLSQLCDVVRKRNVRIDFQNEVVLRDREECGVLIDVSERGNPIFDDDLQIVRDRLGSSSRLDRQVQDLLDNCQCMVTTQVISTSDMYVLDAIWDALGSYRPVYSYWKTTPRRYATTNSQPYCTGDLAEQSGQPKPPIKTFVRLISNSAASVYR